MLYFSTFAPSFFPLISPRQLPPMKDGSLSGKKDFFLWFDIALFFNLLSQVVNIKQQIVINIETSDHLLYAFVYICYKFVISISHFTQDQLS